MKSSLPEADRNDASETRRDDYKACEILPKIGTGYLDKPEQVMAA
jgi:hypothetical protein